MKLDPEELVVTSFPTAGSDEPSAAAGTQSPFCPTPATACYVCPAPSENCA
jgi:hypothetical protein